MVKELAKYEISHNDIGEIERGVWRKYNPYNPYVPEDEKKKVDDLKIDSLDDLFADDDLLNDKSKSLDNTPLMDDIKPMDKQFEPSKMPSIPIDEENDAPMLPMDEEQKTDDSKDDEYDLQKELEAKFDELFGPIDDDDT